jgi:phosphoglucomutase
MERLRDDPPTEMAGSKVITIRDSLYHTTLDVNSGTRATDIDLPSSNVLQYVSEDRTVVSARPSGTEPKIKFYASVCAAPGPLQQGRELVRSKLNRISAWIDEQIAEA